MHSLSLSFSFFLVDICIRDCNLLAILIGAFLQCLDQTKKFYESATIVAMRHPLDRRT